MKLRASLTMVRYDKTETQSEDVQITLYKAKQRQHQMKILKCAS